MKIKAWLLVAVVSLTAGMVQAESKPPNNLQAPLQSAHYRGFDAVKLAQEVNLSAFKTVYIAEPGLSFDAHWLRRHRHDMSPRDEQRLRASYTQLLKTELEQALAEQTQLRVVSQPEPGSLVITPQLVRFQLTAPDLSRGPLVRSFVNQVGAAELQLSMSRGVMGQELAQVVDHQQTRSFAGLRHLKQTNRVVNQRDFRWLFKRWAERTGDLVNQLQG